MSQVSGFLVPPYPGGALAKNVFGSRRLSTFPPFFFSFFSLQAPRLTPRWTSESLLTGRLRLIPSIATPFLFFSLFFSSPLCNGPRKKKSRILPFLVPPSLMRSVDLNGTCYSLDCRRNGLLLFSFFSLFPFVLAHPEIDWKA